MKAKELARKMIDKKSSSDATLHVESKSMVWMPYYRIGFEYRRSEEELIRKLGETAQSETAINAMFCRFARSDNDLSMLFRPNYLKQEMKTCNPQPDEIIGPVFQVDLAAVLPNFLARLNKVKDELNSVRSEFTKRYLQTRKYSMLFPIIGKSKEMERQSKKVAELSAQTHLMNLCLNLTESAASMKILCNSVFYYPTLVISIGSAKSVAKRFLIINLVEKGLIRKNYSSDKVLTEFCNRNEECKEELAKLLSSHHYVHDVD